MPSPHLSRFLRALVTTIVTATAVAMPMTAAAAADAPLQVAVSERTIHVTGPTVAVGLKVVNKGSAPISSGWVSFQVDFGLQLIPYAGCRRTDEAVYCPMDRELQPGEAAKFVTVAQDGTHTDGIRAAVLPYAPVRTFADGRSDVTPPASAVADTQGLGFAWEPTDPPQAATSGFVDAEVFPDTHASFKAIGGTVEGRVGDIVSMDVGVVNEGPAALWTLSQEGPMWWFSIDVPEGTKVRGSSPIDPSDNSLSCGHFDNSDYDLACAVYDNPLMPGTRKIIRLQLEITSPTVGTGQVVDHETRPSDVAPIIVEVVTRSATPSATPNPSPASNRPSAAAGGGLPVTGVKVGLVAGIGGLLLVGGVVFLVLSRRRRLGGSD